jgi:hypothetical protein
VGDGGRVFWLLEPGTLPQHLADDDRECLTGEALSYSGSNLAPELTAILLFGLMAIIPFGGF